MTIYAVDLDGVLCVEDKDYSLTGFINKKPIKENIQAVNKLYRQGHTINVYTARTHGYRPVTEAWLKMHWVKFSNLIMDKPIFDVYVAGG